MLWLWLVGGGGSGYCSEDGDVSDCAVGSREDGIEDGDAADASDNKDGDSGVNCSEDLAVV